jgi:hypothetical protein
MVHNIQQCSVTAIQVVINCKTQPYNYPSNQKPYLYRWNTEFEAAYFLARKANISIKNRKMYIYTILHSVPNKNTSATVCSWLLWFISRRCQYMKLLYKGSKVEGQIKDELDRLGREWLCPDQASIPIFVRTDWWTLRKSSVTLVGMPARIRSTYSCFYFLCVDCVTLLYLCIFTATYSRWFRNWHCRTNPASQKLNLSSTNIDIFGKKLVHHL